MEVRTLELLPSMKLGDKLTRVNANDRIPRSTRADRMAESLLLRLKECSSTFTREALILAFPSKQDVPWRSQTSDKFLSDVGPAMRGSHVRDWRPLQEDHDKSTG
jgi:hypothetical protein